MYTVVNTVVRLLKKIIPEPIVGLFRPFYHMLLALVMTLAYGYPARKLTVIGITGTKGKSTSAEMLFALLRAAGHKTALLSTIRFAIEDESEPNKYKMSLPGRGFAQAFMKKALDAGCTHLVIEVTSESVLQYRHWFLDLDGLIVTNIHKEHIERHGSFEKYVAAKRLIVETLARSPKKRRVLVANADQTETSGFLGASGVTKAIPFSHEELAGLKSDDASVEFYYAGTHFSLPLAGTFNAMNALAVIKMGAAFGVPMPTTAAALHNLAPVQGRVEHIDAGQDFLVVVDYAHTPDSLKALYGAFPKHRKICVLGNTGGGRDTWKRPEMARIAEQSCDEIILTDEDPYDEDPHKIVEEMADAMEKKPTIIMDRREAIHTALTKAHPGDAVLISGKGTDPYIMGPKGTKTPWSDAAVAREELERLAG